MLDKSLKQKAKEMLKRHEGLRLYVYECTGGKKTIGYGRNLEDRGITEAEAEAMLDSDIEYTEQRLVSSFDFYQDLDDVRKAVLIDLAFNIGMAGIKGFKKMLKALEEGDYPEAAIQLLDSRYTTQVPKRAMELARLLDGAKGSEHRDE
jgi:lysozyme